MGDDHMKLSSNKGFTLIELLIVIAILGVLAAAVTIILNPAELTNQSYDANRYSDLGTLSESIALYETTNATTAPAFLTHFMYLYRTSSTCGSWGLPSLPSGWLYSCASNPKNTTGSGWIPINLTGVIGSSISALPLDPVNSSSTGDYYTYSSSGNQYEITANLQSAKYRSKQDATFPLTDYPGVLAVGNSTTISPIYNPSGLVGYWNFNEGSGTTANDISGNGYNGTLSGPAPAWVAGKIGNALQFAPNFPTITNQDVSLGSYLQQYETGQ